MESKKVKKAKGGKKFVWFLIILIIITLIAGCAWLFLNYKNAKSQIADLSNIKTEKQVPGNVTDILEKVKKHIIIYETEMPQIATINDAQELAKSQKFYENAKNGDKILLFGQRAIIYNPTNDILVNVGPVIFQDNEEQGVEEPITMEIRNGTATAGAANEWRNNLSELGSYTTIKIADAANRSYQAHQIINLNNKDVADLEKMFGVAAMTKLPAGEAPSNADVVVIVGETKTSEESAPEPDITEDENNTEEEDTGNEPEAEN